MYDAWGKVKRLPVDLVEQPFRLQGQYFDEETGNCYSRFRYYNPNIGAFISKDPLGLTAGSNVYAFGPNTQKWIDPLGLCKTKPPKTNSTAKPDFYVTPSGKAVPSTGYRYISENAPYLDDLSKTKVIPANPNGTYFSFDKYDVASPGKLQVPHDASVRGSFDTLQVIDDIKVPKGNWGKASHLEPLTKDFPEYGSGGATQAITTKAIKLDNLVKLPK